jgi:hypothetical protein
MMVSCLQCLLNRDFLSQVPHVDLSKAVGSAECVRCGLHRTLWGKPRSLTANRTRRNHFGFRMANFPPPHLRPFCVHFELSAGMRAKCLGGAAHRTSHNRHRCRTTS